MLGLGALGLAALATARAECDNADVQDHLAEARAAYAGQDEARFVAEMAAAEQDLFCLSEPIRRSVAADWHRARAIQAAVSGGPRSRERVVSSLRAGLELDPTVALFPGALPEAYWSSRYEEARTLPAPAAQPVEVQGGGQAYVNGTLDAPRPAGLPAVLQCGSPTRGIEWTRSLAPDEPVPECRPLVLRTPMAVSEPEPPPPARCEGRLSRGATFGLLGGTVLSAGAGAGLAVWNTSAYAAYEAMTEDDGADALIAASKVVNGTQLGAFAAGALAVGGAAGLAWRGCF